ncbi:hypothetical protein Tco_1133235 [Tanacetum coccineum]
MKGAPKCMRISGFMHGVINPELTKRLNEHVPKTMEEMMITTTAFIRGEATTAGKKKGHTSSFYKSVDELHDRKFLVDGGIVTIRRTILIPAECATQLERTLSAKEQENYVHFLNKKNLDIFAMATVRHDRSTAINSETSTQYIGRVFACSTEEKRPGLRACESHPSGATPLSVSWTLTKVITRYRWQSQTKRKWLSTPTKGILLKMPYSPQNNWRHKPVAPWNQGFC